MARPAAPGRQTIRPTGRKPTAAGPARRRGPGGRARADRDAEMLGWLVRFPFATASQILRRLGAPRAYLMRLPRLERAGALASARLPVSGEKAYLATQLAAALIGSEITPPRAFDLRTSRHDLAVTDLAIGYELRGDQVTSERQIRATHALGEGSLAVHLLGDQNGSRLHYPDLLVRPARFCPDGPVAAIELEMAPKRSSRLRGLLNAYRIATHVDHVVYLVERPALQQRLTDLVEAEAMHHKVQVKAWTPFDWATWKPVAGEQRPGSNAGAREQRLRRGGVEKLALTADLVDELLARAAAKDTTPSEVLRQALAACV